MNLPDEGERIDLGGDYVGVVDEIVCDKFGTPAAIVVALDNGKWLALALSPDVGIKAHTVH